MSETTNSVQYAVKVRQIREARNEDGLSLIFEFDKELDVFQQKEKGSEEFIETKSRRISLHAGFAFRSICDLVPDVGSIADAQHDAHTNSLKANETNPNVPIEADFSTAQLSRFLRGATVKLTRTKFAAGEEYVKDGVTMTHDYDGYNTVFDDIELTDANQRDIDKNVDYHVFHMR